MAPNPRVAAAFRAMRQIGIIEEKVKPVLKNLLKLYEKKWELIEAEDYRALADAIFEYEETQAEEEAKKRQERADDQVRDGEEEKEGNKEPERPLKRSRRKQGDQALPSVGNPSSRPNGTLSKQPKVKVAELPDETQHTSNFEDNEEALALSCPPLVRRKGKQPMPEPSSDDADRTLVLTTNGTGKPMSPTTRQREKGKAPISSQTEPDDKILPKQQANNSNAMIQPKDEPVTDADDRSQLVVPLTVVQPEPLDAENSSLPISHSVQDGIQSDGALDAFGVTDRTNNPDNVSYNSENVHKTPHTVVPMHTPSSHGNGCTKIDKEKELNGMEHVNSHDLAVQQFQQTPSAVKPFHEVVDIANGQERIAISLVNEVNDEIPPSFHYIPNNLVFQNAYVNFSLARIGENCCSTCSGDCLSSPLPCACAHETGGEYAYTSQGLVKEDILKESVSMNRDPENHCQFYCSDCPLERNNDGVAEKCQGHLMRRFIKECWLKCGCDNQCGNRVVQRGISRKLQVFMTPEGKGWGLRTLEDLPEGAFVCEYVGEILTNAELFERVSQRRASGEVHAYPVLLDADWGAEGVLKDEEALCLDATNYGNVGRFINHRCVDSNMVELPVEVETPDHHYYHLAFFTTREVKALEELTWDYGIDFSLKGHPVKAFKCRCGSKLCRNTRRNNRSKSRSRRRR